MSSTWPKLNNPPVTVALFQIKYAIGTSKLDDFLKLDHELKTFFPKRVNNIAANINILSSNIPIGTSKVTGTSDAKIASYTYFTEDQKQKLEISEDSITFVDESEYQGWNKFIETVKNCFNIICPVLDGHIINRTSIRFINNFEFADFDNPENYVKTMIASLEENVLHYPVLKYGFKLTLDINENTYSIVNQSLDRPADKFLYTFDIDVLNKNNIVFDTERILQTMEGLREIKNDIFFSNLTQKTLDLCN